jgi:hypothetical protein
MTMKVTNSTEYPRSWHPLVKAITDTGHTYVAGGWGHVLEAIRHRERGRELVAVGETAGRLRPGQSVDTVAVFGPLDPLYDRVEVRVHGLVDPIAVHKVEQYGDQSSEENVVLGADSVVVDSAYWDHNQAILKRLKAAAKESGGAVPRPRVEYLEVAESRYRSIRYERLGDEFFTEDDVIRFRAEAWAVEGTPGSEDGPRALRVVSTDPQ